MTTKISELPSGQVVGNIVDSAQTIKSSAVDGASAIGVVLDTANGMTTNGAQPIRFAVGGTRQGGVQRQAGYWWTFGYTSMQAGDQGVTDAVIKIDGSNSQILAASGFNLIWTATAGAGGANGTADTGIRRYSAGVQADTDGSTGIRGLRGGGTAVASATAMPLPTGRVFHVTGTTNITSITSTNFASGAVITLIFDGVLTFTDGNNLKLAGNFVTTADDTITLAYDGTNWYETSRSVN